MKLLVLADLHFGARFDAWKDQAEAAGRELLHAWNEAVDLVTSPAEGVDGVLVAGDLFHTPDPGISVLEPVFQGLERMATSGKKVVVIPGIYDGLASPRSVYRQRVWPDGITVVDWCRPRVLTLEFGAERLHLMTFAPLPTGDLIPTPTPLPEDGYRAGLFHAVTRAESPLVSWGPRLSLQQMEQLGMQLAVIGGDVHFREALWSSTVVVSPGALVPMRPRDAETSAWTLVSLSSSGIAIERRARTMDLAPQPAVSPAKQAASPRAGGLRGAFLRVYENRRLEADDRELLDAALRYGLEELDRVETLRVD